MRYVRIFTALFLALLWVPSTGYCLLASAFPQTFGECCECEHPGESDGKAPIQDESCDQCVTLESGVNLSSLVPTVAPRPSWCENDDFVQMMQRLMRAVSEEATASAPRPSDDSPPPLHAALLTKAQPVRGPSALA